MSAALAIGLSLVGNATLPIVLESAFHGSTADLAMVFALGCLVAEVGIIAAWFSLATTSLRLRLLAAFTLLAAGTIAYLCGLQQSSGLLPLLLVVFVAAIAAVGFAAMTAFFCLLRMQTTHRLVHEENVGRNSRDKGTFGIGYLMLCTAAIAAIVMLGRQVLPSTDSAGPNNQLPLAVLFALQYVPYSGVFLLTTFWIALCPNRSPKINNTLVALLLVITPVHILLLNTYPVFTMDSESYQMLVAYTAGLVITMAFYSMILRVLGYQLVVFRAD